MTEREWMAVATIAAGLLGVLGLLRVAKARVALDPELARKAMHIALGASAVTYPWLFSTAMPAFVLAALTLGVLITLRLSRGAHAVLGGVVDGVARRSEGELYFPLAVALVFWLAHGDRLLFLVPVLALTVADAAAALVGARYGRTAFTCGDGERKSAEGSSAFFLGAYFSAHVPLVLFSPLGPRESLLIALIFALVVMLVEAVAWRGLDNLFIPLGGLYLLRGYLGMPTRALLGTLAVTAAMLGLVIVLRRRRTLTDGAGLLAVLLGYIAWTIGGLQWVAPLLVLFVTYTVLWPRPDQSGTRAHAVAAVLSVEGASLLWLATRRVLGERTALIGFCATLAAHLAFIGLSWFRAVQPEVRGRMAIPSASLVAWATLMLPFTLVGGSAAIRGAIGALPAVALGTLLFAYHVKADRHSWPRQTAVALLSGAAGALVAGGVR